MYGYSDCYRMPRSTYTGRRGRPPRSSSLGSRERPFLPYKISEPDSDGGPSRHFYPSRVSKPPRAPKPPRGRRRYNSSMYNSYGSFSGYSGGYDSLYGRHGGYCGGCFQTTIPILA
ncbi:uncharacterized protein M421DRAFT_93057 [Didymella exigua CBS 183.55]|uniref:Uncharacterized protein n=1 Tax=Didymella exigua CBS 183.55 TaxID=1150837 RepID=A0A6A5RJ59_9PLEO|nr:uncharacterized protein M421DRAFT_93057 [Didymella exigua CBS 183.55]KAF1927669.1 hypothetical protein M421DRAFT_93057 [Didymella exigua CBS 183.55]